ncbi:MAG: ArsB/NhaD family transporter [Bacilli bacterium]|nr:ArsB/NhaD family transporter [Bacilli bacterium]MDD3069025.1 ArsB/NhaD family transporter [Bacilli bacterium]MDD3841381.1 ArsB/NhaD family transporter [Bacilli bacterium]
MLILIFSLLDPQIAFQSLTNNSAINPLKLLIIFLSLSFISIILDETGFFAFLASFAVNKSKGSQIKLFIILYSLVSFLTVFTSNDIIILTFTPFIIFFCKRANINPIPFLVSEFIAANTWSLFLIIGNPTNIYLGQSFGISFFEYVKVMALPTFFVGTVSFIILFLLFYRQLKVKMPAVDMPIEKVKTPLPMYVALFILIASMVLMAVSNYANLEMYLITICCSVTLAIFVIIYCISKHKSFLLTNTLKRIPYSLIPFVLSMFLIVLALHEQGVTTILANFLGDKMPIFAYGFSSFFVSNLINNIPMTVLFQQIINAGSPSIVPESIYASIVASNIGAFITPIGSLAGLMWMSLLKTYNVKFSFLRFTLYGLTIGIPSIAFGLIGLFIEML